MRSKLLVAGLGAVVAFLLATNPVIVQAAADITGGDIKNNSVKGKDVKDSSLTSKDVKDNSLTGADVDESSLAKVPDADKVDGLDSTSLLPVTAVRGTVQTGVYSAWGGGAGGYVGTEAQFTSRLPVPIPNARTTFIPQGGAFTANCPGVGQAVAPGSLCVYEYYGGSRTFGSIFRNENGLLGASVNGFGIYFDCTAAGCWSYGSWAVNAGAATDVPRPTSADRGAKAPLR